MLRRDERLPRRQAPEGAASASPRRRRRRRPPSESAPRHSERRGLPPLRPSCTGLRLLPPPEQAPSRPRNMPTFSAPLRAPSTSSSRPPQGLLPRTRPSSNAPSKRGTRAHPWPTCKSLVLMSRRSPTRTVGWRVPRNKTTRRSNYVVQRDRCERRLIGR